MNKHKIALLLSSLLVIISLFCASYFPVFFDSGDGIQHYLISAYSFKHPHLFLDHWGKPVFTILSAPFTILGYFGIQLFNILCTAISAFIIYLIADFLKLKFPILGILLYYLTPFGFLGQFSGLTEPLFALFLVLSIYLWVKNKELLSISIISFLPLIRSEGLIILLVYLCFLLIAKKFRIIPFLLLGLFIFSILGFIFKDNFLWIFNENPYNSQATHYQKGDWTHYFGKMPYVLGLPIYALLLLSVFSGLERITKAIKQKSPDSFLLLVYGGFISFFVAHTIFWALGIFNSFGLPRVFIGVLPLIILCILDLINHYFSLNFNFKIKAVIGALLLVYIIVFPFTSNHAAYNLKKNFAYDRGQKLINEAFMVQSVIDKKIYFSHPYVALKFNLDPFDYEQSGKIKDHKNSKSGDYIIWDFWFSPFEDQVKYEEIKENSDYEIIFEKNDPHDLNLKILMARKR